MNFLAHCYLSCSNEELLIGNFITDFINKKQAAEYYGEVKKGIALHRQIDQFTDEHPASLALRRMLRKRHGKYASVVVDLVWDYFLCQNWSHFSGTELSEFSSEMYQIIQKYHDKLPPKLQSRIHRMIEDDFLLAYVDKDRMSKSLSWMDKRVNFPSNFVGALKDVEENEKEIQKLFMQFFPDLIDFVELQCAC
ncbi:MAG: DUF479 domain-containing protein [Saprospiraceae bacterium]|nr:acyl carrier protein phosphodiesterase [Bacteroidia bacterium]NNE16115.1 DUF479 domain-containing protein [Saprospiraceae bacterium]NNL91405.1 DUF479 domain-containing protein [Saprospiraceae bacterium]